MPLNFQVALSSIKGMVRLRRRSPEPPGGARLAGSAASDFVADDRQRSGRRIQLHECTALLLSPAGDTPGTTTIACVDEFCSQVFASLNIPGSRR
jgi:hypothetical protein